MHYINYVIVYQVVTYTFRYMKYNSPLNFVCIKLRLSVETTNKMQPCNRIYYSTVH